MKYITGLGMAALALATAACDKKDAGAPAGNAGTLPAVAAPAGQQWTDVITETPEGGFRIGNPDAKVKLVEYASLTCPHCRDFTAAAAEKLRDQYVKSGQLSWEFRNFVLNPLDVAATLLARCQGPAPFFRLVEQVYANQDGWTKTFNDAGQAELTRISQLPESQQMAAVAKLAGLDNFFRIRGLPEAKADACLADPAALKQVVALRERGTQVDMVTGTPSFLINGEMQEGVFDWPSLEAKLREKIG